MVRLESRVISRLHINAHGSIKCKMLNMKNRFIVTGHLRETCVCVCESICLHVYVCMLGDRITLFYY